MNDGLHGLGLISRRDEGPGLFFIFGSAVDDPPSLFALAGKKKMQRLFTILGGLRFFVHDKGEILGAGYADQDSTVEMWAFFGCSVCLRCLT